MSYEIEVVYTFNEIIPIIHSSTLTKRPIEKHNATTLFTRGQPISSAPGRTNGKNIRLHDASSATHRRQRAIREQVSFNPINFHDTLHGTHSSTTRISLVHLASVLRRVVEEGVGATPSPFSHYHRRLLFSSKNR